MPTVRTYGDQKVKQQGIPDVRMASQRIEGADPDAFGAMQGRQLQQGAKVVNRIGEELQASQDRDDAEKALGAENRFREELIGIHDRARSRQGSNARGVSDETDAEIQKLREKYSSELGNDRQRGIFTASAERMRMSTLESFKGYERQQLDAAHDDEWKSSKELAVAHASADPNPQNLAMIEAELLRKNQYQAQRKGWDATTLENESRKDLTKMHGGIIGSMLDADNVAGAQEYLKAHGDKIDPEVRGRAEKWIHTSQINAAGSAIADQMISSGLTYGEALEQARAKYKGEDGDKILSKVRERYGDAERIKREQASSIADSIDQEAYKAGGFAYVSDTSIEKLSQYDAGAAIRLLKAKTTELENMANRGMRFAKHTNYETQDVIIGLIESGDLRSVEQLEEFAGSLEESDYEAHRALLQGKSEVDAKSVLKAYKVRAGIKPEGQLDEKQTAEYSEFLRSASSYIKDTSRPQDLDVIADNFFINKHNESSWFFDKELPRNAMTEDAIDAEERRKRGEMSSNDPKVLEAQRILREGGKKVTPKNVIKLIQRMEE